MHWKERKKRAKEKEEKSTVYLPFQSLKKQGKFPAEMDLDQCLEFLLRYLRSGEWACKHTRTSGHNTPQGGFNVFVQHEDPGGYASVTGKIMRLPLEAVEFDKPSGDTYFIFEAPDKSNVAEHLCMYVHWGLGEEPLHVEKGWQDEGTLVPETGDWIYRVDIETNDDALSELVGHHVVAAWTTQPFDVVVLHSLWSNGKVLSLSKSNNEVEATLSDDLHFVVEDVVQSFVLTVIK